VVCRDSSCCLTTNIADRVWQGANRVIVFHVLYIWLLHRCNISRCKRFYSLPIWRVNDGCYANDENSYYSGSDWNMNVETLSVYVGRYVIYSNDIQPFVRVPADVISR
jgi:hypothetical protein